MPAPDRKERFQFSTIALFASVLTVAIFGVVIYLQIQHLSQQLISSNNERSLRVIGLSTPVVNRLAADYTDPTGDLVAPPPTDPSKQLDPDVLTISYVATEDPDTFRDGFKELMDHIAQETGKKVEYLPFHDTDAELRAQSEIGLPRARNERAPVER